MSSTLKYLDLRNKNFREKDPAAQAIITQALKILDSFGIPFREMAQRRMERVALAFLAVADLRPGSEWASAKDFTSGRSLGTRDIIDFLNSHFKEDISRGSYDDIRRKDLLLLVAAGVVVQSLPESARNTPTRGYSLDASFASLVRSYGSDGWDTLVSAHLLKVGSLAERFAAARPVTRMKVTIPGGLTLELSPGDHNVLQRAIVEEFLPRFGHGAELLYLGDAADKFLSVNRERLASLGFFEISHGELPDVVAYSAEKNWIFLIEAVHSFGPFDLIRKIKLETNLKNCTAGLVFVTAFQDKAKFRQFLPDLAWEQEIWIADEPDHMVHFNGDKFIGPHPSSVGPSGEASKPHN